MQILLDAGASPNEADKSFHRAPLHLAAKGGYIEELKLLLSANANVNSGDEFIDNPLQVATEAGKLSAVNLLIEAKANVNAQDYREKRPLHRAANGGHLEIIKSLIGAKAVINAKTLWQETPLIFAIHGYYKIRSESHVLAIRHLISLSAEPKFTLDPITTDIVSTKLFFTELKQHNKHSYSQELENSLVAAEINKGAPDISFELCMMISEYLVPDFFKQDILASERSQRLKQFNKPNLLMSGGLSVGFSIYIFLVGTFGSEEQKAQVFFAGSHLGYESLKHGLLMGAGMFAMNKVAMTALEYGVIDKIKKVFNR
jgi:hypothetical protein